MLLMITGQGGGARSRAHFGPLDRGELAFRQAGFGAGGGDR